MVDLSVELSKRNDLLERNIIEFEKHFKVVENGNDRISDEINALRRQTIKSNRCEKVTY